MSELKPCPFCGGQEIDEYEGDYGNGVYCMNCGAMMGEQIHKELHVAERVTYEKAAEAWNTRATLGSGTCEMTVVDTGNEAVYEHHEYIMHCEHCHFEFGLVQYNEDGDTWQDEKPNYCPNCGRKVVDNG